MITATNGNYFDLIKKKIFVEYLNVIAFYRYHGNCVGVTQSLSKKIKAFYCHLCRQKKSYLTIKYKSQFQDFLKTYKSSNTQPTNLDIVFVKFLKETKVIIHLPSFIGCDSFCCLKMNFQMIKIYSRITLTNVSTMNHFHY